VTKKKICGIDYTWFLEG